jgi:centromere protein I
VSDILRGLNGANKARGPLCQLLGVITRRRHVRPYRIQRLWVFASARRWLITIDSSCARSLAMIRRSLGCCGSTGTFTLRSLLETRYLDGRPVSRYVRSSYQIVLTTKRVDIEWRQRLQVIQNAASQLHAAGPGSKGFKVARDAIKGRRSGLLPEVQTFHANEVSNPTIGNPLTG